MNKQTKLLAFALLMTCLSASFAFAQDGLPLYWRQAGMRPQDFEVVVDEKIKHGGKASARVDFIGEMFSGPLSFVQTFKADAYRGKRVRLSAWVKTKSPDSHAQLWFRLDALKRMPGFDNMNSRPVRGITDWAKYDLVLDVPEDVVAIVFGLLSMNQGTIWVDDFSFEIVGNDVAVTNMLTPEAMKQERNNSALANATFPPQPLNLDFEAGANPVRKPVPVDTAIYAKLVGYYTHPNGAFIVIAKEADKLMLDAGGGKTELQPLSESEYFIKSNLNRYLFAKDDKGNFSELSIKSEANETRLKKLNAEEAKARAAQILSAAYAAKGGLEKLKAIRDVQLDSTRTTGEIVASNKFFLSSQFQFRHEVIDKKTGQTNVNASDGKTVWMQQGGRIIPSSSQQFLGFWQQVWLHFTLQPFPNKTMEAIAIDERQLNGKPVDVVVAMIDGQRYFLSFDQQTHFLVRSVRPGGDEFLYEDFRDVDGIKLPFKVTAIGGGAKFLIVMHEYKINAGIEPAKLIPTR